MEPSVAYKARGVQRVGECNVDGVGRLRGLVGLGLGLEVSVRVRVRVWVRVRVRVRVSVRLGSDLVRLRCALLEGGVGMAGGDLVRVRATVRARVRVRVRVGVNVPPLAAASSIIRSHLG